ncbi:hypothetical protein ES705_48293 [subsurface metagenome]
MLFPMFGGVNIASGHAFLILSGFIFGRHPVTMTSASVMLLL